MTDVTQRHKRRQWHAILRRKTQGLQEISQICDARILSTIPPSLSHSPAPVSLFQKMTLYKVCDTRNAHPATLLLQVVTICSSGWVSVDDDTTVYHLGRWTHSRRGATLAWPPLSSCLRAWTNPFDAVRSPSHPTLHIRHRFCIQAIPSAVMLLPVLCCVSRHEVGVT